ncbi:MAG: hypothetical protein Q4G49_17815 [Paracoccus sp. (in: a-proteobacteria)]|nr:hypothetical protein [Paracoccus sp. (in: a-proteobacteria)]
MNARRPFMAAVALLLLATTPGARAVTVPVPDTDLLWIDGLGFRRVGHEGATVYGIDRWGTCIRQLGDDLPGKGADNRNCDYPPERPVRCGCAWDCPPLFQPAPRPFQPLPLPVFTGLTAQPSAPVWPDDPAPVPLAGSMGLLLTGLAALGLARRRKGGSHD